MKTYLLLRSNKQSGPYTLDALMNMGLRSQDLIWIEGQSASWRYPSELDEFKGHVAAPVLEAPQDLGFTQVQNTVVLALPQAAMPSVTLPREETTEFPSLSVFMRQLGDRPEANRQRMVAAYQEVVKDTPSAVFQTLAGMEDLSEEMPTMALQPPPSLHEKSVRVPDVHEVSVLSVAPSSPETPKPPFSKILVTLPAAVPDKTMVVIRRKDQPVSAPTPRQAARRPVLEFIMETPAPAPVSEPAPDSLLTPGQTVVAPAPDLRLSNTVVEHMPEVSVVQQVAQVSAPETVEKTNTLQVNVFTIQKIAVAAAILSLIAVAVLIANAVFNPDAYNFQTNRPKAIPARSNTLPARDVPSGTSTSGTLNGQQNTGTVSSAGQDSPSSTTDDSGGVQAVKHDK